MRILLVGHGRMGRMVGDLASEYECEIAGVIDPQSAAARRRPRPGAVAGGVDVAIDFTFPDAVKTNVEALARLGINMVIGTTGWAADEPAVRRAVADAGIGVVAAPNFSAGVVIFEAIVARAAASVRGAARVRRLCARSASRREEGRAVGHGAVPRAGHAGRRLHTARSTCRPRGPAIFQGPTRSDSTARPRPSC